MSQGASLYPVSQLIASIIRNSGYSPSGFISSLGHPVAEPGLTDLESWLTTGEGHGSIVAQIAAVYPEDAEELTRAVRETAAMKAAGVDPASLERSKKESSFRPYVHVDGETPVPNGVTLFGISGGHERWTTISIPVAVLKLPLEEQLTRLPELMEGYLKEYGGACPFFGIVTGFRFVRRMDYFQFDQGGKFIEHVEETFRRGMVTVWMA